MTDGVTVAPKVMGEEDKRLRRKHSLEAAVTSQLGYGKKKKFHVDAFYSAVWPILTLHGWTLVKGKGEEEGATYFVPPGVSMGKSTEDQDDASQSSTKESSAASPNDEGPWECSSCGFSNSSAKSRCTGKDGEGHRCMAWRGGKRRPKPYFSKIRDVIERVLEKKNEVETKAADKLLEIVPDAHDIFAEQKEKKTELSKEKKAEVSSPSRSSIAVTQEEKNDYEKSDKKPEMMPSPSRTTRQNNNDDDDDDHHQHFAWKDEKRTHYEKSCSRVGSEFQVSVLPAAGSYSSATTASSDGYDGGVLFERVWDPEDANKLGKLDFVHTRVNDNKKAAAYLMFHSRGYRLPGFYQEVSNLSPTDCSEWTKEDKDNFRSAVFEYHEDMKEVSKAIGKPISECITYYIVKFKRTKSYKSLKRSMKRKANVSEGNAGTLVCNECGKGGMLIACDTCEAHYHLGCAAPPLTSIPDGNWACGNCKRATRSMLSSEDDASTNTDQNAKERSVEKITKSSEPDNESKEAGVKSIEEAENDGPKRKLEEEKDSSSEHTNGDSISKKVRMDDVNEPAASSILA